MNSNKISSSNDVTTSFFVNHVQRKIEKEKKFIFHFIVDKAECLLTEIWFEIVSYLSLHDNNRIFSRRFVKKTRRSYFFLRYLIGKLYLDRRQQGTHQRDSKLAVTKAMTQIDRRRFLATYENRFSLKTIIEEKYREDFSALPESTYKRDRKMFSMIRPGISAFSFRCPCISRRFNRHFSLKFDEVFQYIRVEMDSSESNGSEKVEF